MDTLNTGTYGAKVQSWRRANPRDLLKSLMDENPKADKASLLKDLRDEVLTPERQDELDSIIEYWFSNNYHSLVTPPPAVRRAREKEARALVADAAKKIEAAVSKKAEMILLDMVLPNGKALRDCTGKDCARLGNKIGPWLKKIAEKVEPTQRVGDILSENQVRAMYRG